MKPREKIVKYGPQKLEGAELVATILGTGVKGTDVFQLSRKVNKIIEEKRDAIRIEDLMKIHGIWEVKAIQIISAFELARRYFIKDTVIIKNIDDILAQVKEYREKKQEYLIGITLDGANRLINKRIITIWLLNQNLIHPREVFANALEERANSIILVHNHPSWTIEPSDEDIVSTNKLKKASNILWIHLLDHVIITQEHYFSFKENNIF